MTLPSPNLDDRNFNELKSEALKLFQGKFSNWKEDPSDPAMVLLEAFSHMTEIMLYRLNRLPKKAYVAFLNLIGVRLYPPTAASVKLKFSTNLALNSETLIISKGTRVTASQASSEGILPIFVTVASGNIEPGREALEILAYHYEYVKAELAGTGNGQPNLSLQLKKAPILAPTKYFQIEVGVEIRSEDSIAPNIKTISDRGKTYRIWDEVSSFTPLHDRNSHVYTVDYVEGKIIFAPEVTTIKKDWRFNNISLEFWNLLFDIDCWAAFSLVWDYQNHEVYPVNRVSGAIPPADREIRVWYPHGGGLGGNIGAGQLTILQDEIEGVEVTNLQAASGGSNRETLENALNRGTQELYTLNRAVTAKDFEVLAKKCSRAISQAVAFAKSDFWGYAQPGTVEVLLVPHLDRSDTVKSQIKDYLEPRCCLGIICEVNWVKYKTVKVSADINTSISTNTNGSKEEIKRRIIKKLQQFINPLKTEINPSGWSFGQSLTEADVYRHILSEPEVLSAENVRFEIEDEMPEQKVGSLAIDSMAYKMPSQFKSWYAATDKIIFRSINNGESWETLRSFVKEEDTIYKIATDPEQTGAIAIITHLPELGTSKIYCSLECGETWDYESSLQEKIIDLAWTRYEGSPLLLLLTERKLYEMKLGEIPREYSLAGDLHDKDLKFSAIALSRESGKRRIALATRGTRGIFLSDGTNNFQDIGLQNEDVRILAIQEYESGLFLWAGLNAGPKEGCYRYELTSLTSQWQYFPWKKFTGSCLSLKFQGSIACAATYRRGVITIDTDNSKRDNPQDLIWQELGLDCGLPISNNQFKPIKDIALSPVGVNPSILLAGGLQGIYRRQDSQGIYQCVSSKKKEEKVKLPKNYWLFCSGQHEITIKDG